MREEFRYMAELPGTTPEQAWVRDRLETLSAREGIVLTAAARRCPPECAADAINCLQSLDDYEVWTNTGSREALGMAFLRSRTKIPGNALPFVDLAATGEYCEGKFPGLFIENCYVEYPRQDPHPAYRSRDTPLPEDNDWSVMLKLASPAAPEGVWLRLPGHDGKPIQESDEAVLALDALNAKSLKDCTLLEARCILPEAGNLMRQYDSVTDLVRDGDHLGITLEEQGQGEPHWMEKFAAALEYENCRTLKFALDISQNLHCYNWVPSSDLAESAVGLLLDAGMSEDLIYSCGIDLAGYKSWLLENSGYMLTADESAYIIRNDQVFSYNYSTNEEVAALSKNTPAPKSDILPEDILSASPPLAALAANLSPEETFSVNVMLRESLAGRGPDGLRQLHTAMEYEECDSLRDAMEIAAHLDCYGFVDIHGFCEATKADFLAKGVDKRALRCFDYETYAALTHDFDFIHTSRNNGMYLCKTDQSFQIPKWQEQPPGPSM